MQYLLGAGQQYGLDMVSGNANTLKIASYCLCKVS